VRLASFRVYVEAKPHALSHTTKQSSGTATSNGEIERPRIGTSSETSAHTFFRALGELADELSRPAPAIVRRPALGSGFLAAVCKCETGYCHRQ